MAKPWSPAELDDAWPAGPPARAEDTFSALLKAVFETTVKSRDSAPAFRNTTIVFLPGHSLAPARRVRFSISTLFLTFLFFSQAQARVACQGVYQTKSVESIFEVVGNLTLLSEAKLSEFVSHAQIAEQVPSKPFLPDHKTRKLLSEDLLAYEGLPLVHVPQDARMIPVISKVVESPHNSTLEKLSLPLKPPTFESRGQFLLQLEDGSWIGAKPLLSTLIFDHSTVYENFRFGSALDEPAELAKGVRLAIELGDANLSAKVHGVWFDSNETPFLIHALTHHPQRQRQNENKWNASDLQALELVLQNLQTNLKADTLDIFAIERRDLTDENLRQSLKQENQESPIRFEKETDGRIQISGFKYSAWYFHKFGMNEWLKAISPPDHTPPSGIETPFNARNGLFTLIRLENVLKAPISEAQIYLQALQTTNPQAFNSLKRLINELKDVERLKALQALTSTP